MTYAYVRVRVCTCESEVSFVVCFLHAAHCDPYIMNQPKLVTLETSMVRNLYETHSHNQSKYAETFCLFMVHAASLFRLFHMLMLEFNLLLQGDVSVELYWNHAPKTCRNFAELVNHIAGKGSCE